MYDNELDLVDSLSTARQALISSIQLCPSISDGLQLHAAVVELGLVQDFLLSNLLISMYHTHGDREHACRVFHAMNYRTIVSWNTLIMAYSTSGSVELSFQIFVYLLHEDVKPDEVTFVCIIAGCTTPDTLEPGRLIHAYAIEFGLSFDVKVANALINMYSKCGALDDACMAFEAMPKRNVISWTAIITAHCHHGDYNKCFEILGLMEQHGVQPNDVTFISILGACISESFLKHGLDIHAAVVENGYMSTVAVINALISMYGKCGALRDSYKLFCNTHNCDVDSWNSMICVYIQHGKHDKGLQLFKEMQERNIQVNEISFILALSACTTPSFVHEGMLIHARSIESGLVDNITVRSALISMYSKCGAIEMVRILYGSAKHVDLILWTAVITGYAQHGYGKMALELFVQMQQEGWRPNSVTFISILSACSHAGLIDEGCRFFNIMVEDFRITPETDHFSCIIDLLGKAGQINEAASMLSRLFSGSDSTVCRAFLAACSVHNNSKQVGYSIGRILESGPTDMAIYTLLSNINAANGQCVE
ncbi:hypothetical protein KP509_31G026600 [Ceratopteris richardii]|nr:hypothetical protein KP509_31G026600 [Ceratopteris richardii]